MEHQDITPSIGEWVRMIPPCARYLPFLFPFPTHFSFERSFKISFRNAPPPRSWNWKKWKVFCLYSVISVCDHVGGCSAAWFAERLWEVVVELKTFFLAICVWEFFLFMFFLAILQNTMNYYFHALRVFVICDWNTLWADIKWGETAKICDSWQKPIFGSFFPISNIAVWVSV